MNNSNFLKLPLKMISARGKDQWKDSQTSPLTSTASRNRIRSPNRNCCIRPQSPHLETSQCLTHKTQTFLILLHGVALLLQQNLAKKDFLKNENKVFFPSHSWWSINEILYLDLVLLLVSLEKIISLSRSQHLTVLISFGGEWFVWRFFIFSL